MARASYLRSARAMALGATPLAGFCAATWPDFAPPLTAVGVAVADCGFDMLVVIDKSGANLAGLQNMNWLLLFQGWFWLIDILQVKYLNNIIEQDHRFINKLTRPMKGFKSFSSASATLDGIEVAHMIRKNQLQTMGPSAFQQFAALAGQLRPAITKSAIISKKCDGTSFLTPCL
ncbi:hypothetical protein ACSSV8_003657 [Roseovarius sp. MBR-79]|jgi:hypothetical protein